MRMARISTVILLLAAMSIEPVILAQEIVEGTLKGALVGGLIGGSKGSRRGAAVGAGLGTIKKVDRHAREEERQRQAESRAAQQSTQTYQEAPHADFNTPSQAPNTAVIVNVEQPPNAVLITPPSSSSLREVVLQENGASFLGVAYPVDWKQTVTPTSVTAVSEDGLIWSTTSILDGSKDLASAENRVKDGLRKDLDRVAFQDTEVTEGGSHVVSGTARDKESGANLEFTFGVFEAAPARMASILFIADDQLGEMFSATVEVIAASVKVAADF